MRAAARAVAIPLWIWEAAHNVTRDWAAPILWGSLNGYTPEAIAAGLDLEPVLVVAVIRRFAPWRLPAVESGVAPLRPAASATAEPRPRDPRWAVWARQRAGARARLTALSAAAGVA